MNNLDIVKKYFKDKKMEFKFEDQLVDIDTVFANDGFAPGMLRRLFADLEKYLDYKIELKLEKDESAPLKIKATYDFKDAPKSIIYLILITSLESMASYNDDKYIDFDEYLYD